MDKSKEHNGKFLRLDMLTLHDPIIQVIIQIAIALHEMQLFKDRRILHDIQTVVDIAGKILGQDQGVLDQLLVRDRCGEI